MPTLGLFRDKFLQKYDFSSNRLDFESNLSINNFRKSEVAIKLRKIFFRFTEVTFPNLSIFWSMFD